MLSCDGFGFELTGRQLLCFCIYFLWFMNKPNTRWILQCYKQEPQESSPSWFLDPLWNGIGPTTEWLPCMNVAPLNFGHERLGCWCYWSLVKNGDCSVQGFFAALDLYKRSPACQIECVAFFYSTWSTDILFSLFTKNITISKTTFPYPLGV